MPSVLIVDHEGTERRSLALVLGLEGFQVGIAESENSANEQLAEQAGYDVVLVDLMIPGLNGLHLARSIRQTYPRSRIVLTSAYPLSQRQLERADCGAVGFVPKPYELYEVSRYLRSKIAPVMA